MTSDPDLDEPHPGRRPAADAPAAAADGATGPPQDAGPTQDPEPGRHAGPDGDAAASAGVGAEDVGGRTEAVGAGRAAEAVGVGGRAGRSGPGRVIAGVCLGVAGVAAAVAVALAARSDDPAPGGPATVPRPAAATPSGVRIDDVAVGQCYQVGRAGPAATVTVVGCAAPHDRELFGRVTLPAGPYPGDAALERAARHRCEPLFTRYAGRPVGARLSYTLTVPLRTAWVAGNRRVTCATTDPTGRRLTGSARGR